MKRFKIDLSRLYYTLRVMLLLSFLATPVRYLCLSRRSVPYRYCRSLVLIIRGGVEDTRLEANAKDTKKFRGQTLSRPSPRTQAQVFSKKKDFQKNFSSNLKNQVFKIFFQAKKVFKNFFSRDFYLRKTKKGLRKFSARFLALSNKISTVQKIVLSSSRGQGNFRGLEASRPRTSKSVLEDSTSV